MNRLSLTDVSYCHIDVLKRDKPQRRPSSVKVKQKAEEPVVKVEPVSSADDTVAMLHSLPQLRLLHPDVNAQPDSLAYQTHAPG